MKQLIDFIKESLNEDIKYCEIDADDYFDIVFGGDDGDDYSSDFKRTKKTIRNWFAKNTKGKKLAIYCDEDSFDAATSYDDIQISLDIMKKMLM